MYDAGKVPLGPRAPLEPAGNPAQEDIMSPHLSSFKHDFLENLDAHLCTDANVQELLKLFLPKEPDTEQMLNYCRDKQITTHEMDGLIRDNWTKFPEIVQEANNRNLDIHIETRVEKEHGFTEIVVYSHDHPGLFSRIAGAMALSGATIVDAKIVTLANGMALDQFSIQDINHLASTVAVFKGGVKVSLPQR